MLQEFYQEVIVPFFSGFHFGWDWLDNLHLPPALILAVACFVVLKIVGKTIKLAISSALVLAAGLWLLSILGYSLMLQH